MTNWRYHWAQSSANEANKKMNTSLACVRRGRDFFSNFSYCLFLIQYLLFSLSFFLSLANLCRAWNKTLETSRFLFLPSEQSRAGCVKLQANGKINKNKMASRCQINVQTDGPLCAIVGLVMRNVQACYC